MLGRRPEDLEMYKRFKETQILSSWVSTHDYLMCQVFGCPWAVDSAKGLTLMYLMQTSKIVRTDAWVDVRS